MYRFFSIIPARGGSKGIIKKNLTLLAGKPLIYYTIQSSIFCEPIDKTIVTTDDHKIREYALGFDLKVISRPNRLADDKSTLLPVITHVFEVFSELKDYDYFILLQPTSPLRTEKHIRQALNLLEQKKATTLISVTKAHNSPLKSFVFNKKGYLQGLVNNEYPFMSRQELPQTYYPNGAIYIQNVKEFLKTGNLFSNKTIPFIMNDQDSIDIDTIEDLVKAEKAIADIG